MGGSRTRPFGKADCGRIEADLLTDVNANDPPLEEPDVDEPDETEDDTYGPYFMWNPPWSPYEAADQLGSGDN